MKVRPVRGSKAYSEGLFLFDAETPIARSAGRESYAAFREELICKGILINGEAHCDANLNEKLSV